MIVTLKKRSLFQRIVRVPKQFWEHYSIIRRHASRFTAVRVAVSFSWLLIKA